MAFNLKSIKRTKVSRDLSSKSFFIYGEKKSGKTSNAVKFEKSVLLATERGYNMLDNVAAVPISKWKELLEVKKALLQDAKEVEDRRNRGDESAETEFKTVIVDTADRAYDMCEEYILLNEGCSYLDETIQMRGYKELEREFDKFFQDLVMAGYTLVIISHSETVQVKINGQKYDRTQPTLPKRGLKVVSRLVDIIAYASVERTDDGETKMMLTMRGNQFLEAGSRNKYTSETIPFTYEALLADMTQAMDKLQAEGVNVVNTPITKEVYSEPKKVDFDAVDAQIKTIAKALKTADKFDRYTEVVEKILGKGKKVKDCQKDQGDLLELILDDLKDVIKEEGVEI